MSAENGIDLDNGRTQCVPTELELALAEIEPDELTPKQALEALYRLKTLLG